MPFSVKAEQEGPQDFYDEVNIYQYLKKDQLRMTPFRYRAYIRPQLRSIRTEYYQLLRRVRPGHDYLIDLKTKVESIESSWQDFKEQCPEVVESCRSPLQKLRAEIQELDSQLLKYQAFSFTDFSKLQVPPEDIFELFELFSNMNSACYQITHKLEQMQMLAETPYLKERQLKHEIERQVSRLRVFSEVALNSLISEKYSILFESLWRNFIRPIDLEILGKNNPDYLMTNLERLNHSFNEFHMRLSKGQHQLPENELQAINTVHRRWNTVLRILVRDI